MTAKEELKEIFNEHRLMKSFDPKTDKAVKGIYKALMVLADRIDKEEHV